QVVMGEGDGWVRGYEVLTGKKLWEFDLNPKDSVWPKTRNEVISTPVIWENKVFIADRKSTRLNSSHGSISYAVFCLKKKNSICKKHSGINIHRYQLHPNSSF